MVSSQNITLPSGNRLKVWKFPYWPSAHTSTTPSSRLYQFSSHPDLHPSSSPAIIDLHILPGQSFHRPLISAPSRCTTLSLPRHLSFGTPAHRTETIILLLSCNDEHCWVCLFMFKESTTHQRQLNLDWKNPPSWGSWLTSGSLLWLLTPQTAFPGLCFLTLSTLLSYWPPSLKRGFTIVPF